MSPIPNLYFYNLCFKFNIFKNFPEMSHKPHCYRPITAQRVNTQRWLVESTGKGRGRGRGVQSIGFSIRGFMENEGRIEGEGGLVRYVLFRFLANDIIRIFCCPTTKGFMIGWWTHLDFNFFSNNALTNHSLILLYKYVVQKYNDLIKLIVRAKWSVQRCKNWDNTYRS